MSLLNRQIPNDLGGRVGALPRLSKTPKWVAPVTVGAIGGSVVENKLSGDSVAWLPLIIIGVIILLIMGD